MHLNGLTIEDWLKNPPDDSFPYGHRVDYFRRYQNLKEFCLKNVHKHIALGANLKDKEIFLNDHGIEHINTVIIRATELIKGSKENISPKEIFYLLCAIQLHDVGNIFGRYQHELKSSEVIKDAGILFSDDNSERQLIWKIAKVHGGRNSLNGKDTISELSPYKNMFGELIRTQLLSAILRFSDELADDRSRAAQWPLDKNIIPEPSKIYHEFSISLNSVTVDHDHHAINLEFEVNEEKLQTEFTKESSKIFLIDEIYDRIMKMHLEKIYCMRFMKRLIDIDRIHVNIEFLSNFLDVQVKFNSIEMTLAESGFPEKPKNGIFDICPLLVDNGTVMDGKYFANKASIT